MPEGDKKVTILCAWCGSLILKKGLTWNQMALTILLRTNKGRTQRALKTEVRMNSNQDHTLPWREGSPGVKTALLIICFP